MDRIKSKDYEADAIIGWGFWRIGIEVRQCLFQIADIDRIVRLPLTD